MNWYCNKCKKIHQSEELCPKIESQLKANPKLLIEASNFIIIAGQHALISKQTLDSVAKNINKIAGTNLSYEGTKQFARDIQVFRRLNEEAFSKSGVFSTSENAKNYLNNVIEASKNSPRSMISFESKLTGSAQEVDWVRLKQGQLSSLWEKSSLLNKNAPGVDGITVNRFTGKTINRTTIKASSYAGENTQKNIANNVKKVEEAIEKGNATKDDIIFGTEGTKSIAKKVGVNNPVVEKNTPQQVSESNKRLKQKIMDGQATDSIAGKQLGKKMVQGAIVGAAIAVTISGITNYIRFRNGELAQDEAFKAVSEDTLKGVITGSGMTGVSIFLPVGMLGFIGGMAVGVYLNKVCTNILDEIYGIGAYGTILDSSGYVRGMTFNLAEYYEKIQTNNNITNQNIIKSNSIQKEIDKNFIEFERLKGE